MNKYINLLKKLNEKAKMNGDVPVSCIIIKDNNIISKGYNRREINNNPIDHAEIIAIRLASKKTKTWNLSGCTLISTLKPCKMCIEVIKAAKIRKVFYILDNNKIINNKLELCKLSTNEYDYFEKELKNFFKDKR